jgi:hypothetical protein
MAVVDPRVAVLVLPMLCTKSVEVPIDGSIQGDFRLAFALEALVNPSACFACSFEHILSRLR